MKLFFELKTKSKENKDGYVRAVLMDGKSRELINTGLKATKKEWNKGAFKNIAATANKRAILLNYTQAFNTYLLNCERATEQPSLTGAKAAVLSGLNKTEKKERKNLSELFDKFISDNIRFEPATVAQYKVVQTHINNHKSNTQIVDINQNWWDGFVKYLSTELKDKDGNVIKKANQNVTVNKVLGKIKSFCRWANTKKLSTSKDWATIKAENVAKQRIVFLTKEELTQYYFTEFKQAYLNKAKLVACFSGFTGLRYSDLKQVNKSNIITEGAQKYLLINTQKTDTELKLPLTKEAVKILEQFNYELPVISNQKLNQYIKSGLKQAGINSQITVNVNHLNKTEKKLVYKYEVFSIHDMRKGFIISCLISGMNPAEVMKLSTHTEYKSFAAYVDFASEHLANKLNSVSFLTATSAPHLKVVS